MSRGVLKQESEISEPLWIILGPGVFDIKFEHQSFVIKSNTSVLGLTEPLAVSANVSPVRDGLLVCVVPPFSPVSEPRLEWKVGLFSLDPDGAPCRSTRKKTSAQVAGQRLFHVTVTLN